MLNLMEKIIIKACELYVRWERWWEKQTYELLTGELLTDDDWYGQ